MKYSTSGRKPIVLWLVKAIYIDQDTQRNPGGRNLISHTTTIKNQPNITAFNRI